MCETRETVLLLVLAYHATLFRKNYRLTRHLESYFWLISNHKFHLSCIMSIVKHNLHFDVNTRWDSRLWVTLYTKFHVYLEPHKKFVHEMSSAH